MALSLTEFLNRDIVPPPMIIERGILPVQSKLVIGGPPKTGKSFFAMNIGLDLATGRPLFGAKKFDGKPLFNVPNKQRVLYIEKEIGEWSLMKRFRQMTTGQRLENYEFYIHPRDKNVRLDSQQGKAAIRGLIEIYKPQVVILDPLAAFHGYDENSAQQMGQVMRSIDEWLDEFTCSFIIVHHTGHPDPKYPRRGGDKLRGSTAVFGSVDSVIIHELANPNKSEELEPDIRLTFEIRHDEPIHPLTFRRKASGLYQFQGEGYTNKTALVDNRPAVKRMTAPAANVPGYLE